MLIDKLILHNFCIYRGIQTIDLQPKMRRGHEKNVVLIGGINGGGKTTILDAVQLVLYGKRAQCSKRIETSYEDFLANCIHRDAPQHEGAAITLSFSYTSEGKENLYEIVRSWKKTVKSTKETIEVRKNGDPDLWLSNNWAQIVEDILPYGISQICFFDAEKIRLLADDETTSETLGESIKSLLGLDLAQRLIVDCHALRTRIISKNKKLPEAKQMMELEKDQERIGKEIDALIQELGGMENERAFHKKKLMELERKFASMGGEHWKKREEIQHQRGILEQEIKQIRDRLIAHAFTELPLALLDDTLKALFEIAKKEKRGVEIKQSLASLAEHDTRLARFMKKISVPALYLKEINAYLANERTSLSEESHVEQILNLPSRGYQILSSILDHDIKNQKKIARADVEEYKSCCEALEEVLRNLSVIPDDSKIESILAEIKDMTSQLGRCNGQISNIEKALESKRQERALNEKKIMAFHNMAISVDINTDERKRVIERISQTQKIMEQYLRKMVVKKIERLSTHITDALHTLLRKKTLIHRVVIDPDSFAISFYGQKNEIILKQELSEGEKQIFAISVLWGLAKSSPRPLPMIIDTPMARLDSIHRKKLVEHYFPNASHQVLVLSTDTEVEPHLLNLLKKHISHSYYLNYCEEQKVTTIEEGFFWELDN